MQEFYKRDIEEKQQILLEQLEKCRHDDSTYNIDYRDESFTIDLSEELAKQYVIQSVRVAEECLRLEESGELTIEMINDFQQHFLGKYKDEDERHVWSIVKGFAPDGIYDKEVFHDVVRKIGELNGDTVGSGAWMLFQRPVLDSAILSVVEASVGRMTEDQIYFATAWYFLRSCFYIRTGRNE